MTQFSKEKIGFTLIIVVTFISVPAIFLQDPIAQDINYHLFRDSKEIFSIQNFWNVLSNLPFLMVGVIGLYQFLVTDSLKIIKENKFAYSLLFFGVTLIAFGSGYYHLWPNNQTLVWDRLPMSIAFMSLFSIVIGEFISIRAGKALLLPLILLGIASVFYWHFSEIQGAGDLRFYALVQFYPMLVIPLILVCFNSRCSKAKAYWWLLVAYVIAKAFEHFDGEIYNMLGFISGHSIKHIVAALGLYILFISYLRRSCT